MRKTPLTGVELLIGASEPWRGGLLVPERAEEYRRRGLPQQKRSPRSRSRRGRGERTMRRDPELGATKRRQILARAASRARCGAKAERLPVRGASLEGVECLPVREVAIGGRRPAS